MSEFRPDLEPKKFETVPAQKGFGVKNCVVINASEVPALVDIVAFAVSNEAFVDNEGTEEAGDDSFLVQFPGHEQELLDQFSISGRLRELSGDGE